MGGTECFALCNRAYLLHAKSVLRRGGGDAFVAAGLLAEETREDDSADTSLASSNEEAQTATKVYLPHVRVHRTVEIGSPIAKEKSQTLSFEWALSQRREFAQKYIGKSAFQRRNRKLSHTILDCKFQLVSANDLPSYI